MKTVLLFGLILGGVTMLCLTTASPVMADETPRLKIPQITPIVPGTSGFLAIVPSFKNAKVFDVTASNVTAIQVFRGIEQAAGVRIVVADNVQMSLFGVYFRQTTVDKMVEMICTNHGLAWGKIGEDTYIVVSQNTPPITVRVIPSEPATPRSPQPPSPYDSEPRQAPTNDFRFWLLGRSSDGSAD